MKSKCPKVKTLLTRFRTRGGKISKREFAYKIAKSSIKKAGKGLFYMGETPISPFTRVALYGGKLVKEKHLGPSKNDYLFEDKVNGEKVIIDAQEDNVYPGKYANDIIDSSSGLKTNAQFVPKTIRKSEIDSSLYVADFMTTRKIQKGDEIFLNYGEKYWGDLKK